MKIIRVDNFGRETVSDELVCENVNKYYAKAILAFLIEKYSGDTAPSYFRLVENNYKLYTWEP